MKESRRVSELDQARPCNEEGKKTTRDRIDFYVNSGSNGRGARRLLLTATEGVDGTIAYEADIPMTTKPKAKKVKMVCTACGSDDVRRNADCAWSVQEQEWEVAALFDSATCEACGGECSITEKETE